MLKRSGVRTWLGRTRLQDQMLPGLSQVRERPGGALGLDIPHDLRRCGRAALGRGDTGLDLADVGGRRLADRVGELPCVRHEAHSAARQRLIRIGNAERQATIAPVPSATAVSRATRAASRD